MVKLSPMPTDCEPKGNWKDLDEYLLACFSNLVCGTEQVVHIDPERFEMELSEMEAAIKEAGYTIKVSNGLLVVSNG